MKQYKGPRLRAGRTKPLIAKKGEKTVQRYRICDIAVEIRWHTNASIILLFSSPKPTLEDTRSWAMSFEKVMKSAAGRSCFRQFLRTEFSEENMMFWLACEELKKETKKTVVEEKVRQIYEDFISILSPKEVSK